MRAFTADARPTAAARVQAHAAATTSTAQLTPRQRRLAEKQRLWKEEQERRKAQSGSPTPSQASTSAPSRNDSPPAKANSAQPAKAAPSRAPPRSTPRNPPSILPDLSNWTLQTPVTDQRWARQHARAATGAQLAQAAKAWADSWVSDRPSSPTQARIAQANIDTLAAVSLERLSASKQSLGPSVSQPDASSRPAASTAPAPLSQQELADLAWALRHFNHPAASQLDEAMQVPFRVLPHQLPHLQLSEFVREIELRQETIQLGEDKVVPESRLTAWQSDIGTSFKYSGKEMTGPKLSPEVAKVRDQLQALTGQHFDSCLINYYADGRCGMRFHVDPLYGCWTPHSAVVSIGQTRRFVFREIDDYASRWEYQVRNGDVVYMYRDCQDRLQHSIKVEREERGAAELGPRMSLVFKQRLRDAEGNYVQG